MPVADYGILIGQNAAYYRDQPNNQGKYMHGHIDVQTPAGLYDTAIDVDVIGTFAILRSLHSCNAS